MDSQFTPIHTHLWNHEFRMLILGCMLLTVSAYMQLPVLQWLFPTSSGLMAWGYVAFSVGLFLPGVLVSFLVERYRRNWVCIWAIVGYVASIASLGLVHSLPAEYQPTTVVCLRLLSGVMYGLAQMVLVSTLMADCCESDQRTAANYATAWVQRISLAVGAALGCLALFFFKDDLLLCVVCPALAAIGLIFMVRFPFRAPEDASFHFSTDRFLLLEGLRIPFHVFLLAIVLGMLIVGNCTIPFFTMLTIGFFAALLSEIFLRRHSMDNAEPMMGMALLTIALLLYLCPLGIVTKYVVPLLIGCAVGLAAARLQLFLIHVSPHCRRGTSQSTFWIAWESGVMCGIAFAYAMNNVWGGKVYSLTGIILTLVSILVFYFHTRHWYKPHKLR